MATAAHASSNKPAMPPTVPCWLIVGLVLITLLGTSIGVLAMPSAWPSFLLSALAQLAVTLTAPAAQRRPVAWAVAVAVVSLATAVASPALAEIAGRGGAPWIGMATAVAALLLYRRATSRLATVAGTVALGLGCVGVVAVTIRGGLAPTPAVLATTIYPLLGIAVGFWLQLQQAREDRLRQSDPPPLEAVPSGMPESLYRALTIVAVRADELADSGIDEGARRTGADLRDVARRALTGDASAGGGLSIEIMRSGAAAAAATPEPTREPMPDLADREREILRLLTTGASNAAIARSLYLSEATVKQYVSRSMRRFDCDNRTQLALRAARWFPSE